VANLTADEREVVRNSVGHLTLYDLREMQLTGSHDRLSNLLYQWPLYNMDVVAKWYQVLFVDYYFAPS
jgi:hypothetical protein